MAGDKIVHRISLEGADKVAKQLESIGLEGDKSAKKIQQAFNDASNVSGKSGDAFGGLKTEESRQGVERLREAIHILHPILDTAGLGLGNLGAFARVAGAGLGALGAAIVGSVVVGLAKLVDEADVAKKKLADLGASKGAFPGLSEDARRLKTDVTNLQPVFEQFLKMRNDVDFSGNVRTAPGAEPFKGGPFSEEKGRASTGALLSLAEAAKIEDPSKAATDFLAGVTKSKGVTSDVLRGAADQSEGFANQIAKSLPQRFAGYRDAISYLDRGGRISQEDLVRGLSKVAPEAEKAAESVRGLKQAFDGAGASAKELAKSITGEDLGKKTTGFIDKISDVAGHLKGNVEGIKSSAASGYDVGSELGLKTKIPGAGIAGGIAGGFIGSDIGLVKEVGSELLNNPPGRLLSRALTDPGSFQEQQRPETGPHSLGATGPFEYIPPPKEDFQYIPPPPAETIGPRSDAGDQAMPAAIEQLASTVAAGDSTTQSTLAAGFAAVVAAISAELQKPTAPETGPIASAAGIRGATGLLLAGGGRIDATGGGHIEGPGTPTSDSIPLWGSRKEFMVKADAVESVGVPFMHRLNQLGRKALGAVGLAAGGEAATGGATKFSDLAGNVSVTYDPDSGGAYINGNLFPPGNPLLDDPQIKQLIEQSKPKTQGTKKRGGKHSDFIVTDQERLQQDADAAAYDAWNVSPEPDGSISRGMARAAGGLVGRFANGGLVGGIPGLAEGVSPVSRFASRLSAMGLNGTFDMPHLAIGGMMDHFDPVSREAMDSIAGPASGSGPLHPVTLNLPGGESVDGFHAEPGAVKQLSRAASHAKRFSTGPKPGWYGGNAR